MVGEKHVFLMIVRVDEIELYIPEPLRDVGDVGPGIAVVGQDVVWEEKTYGVAVYVFRSGVSDLRRADQEGQHCADLNQISGDSERNP